MSAQEARQAWQEARRRLPEVVLSPGPVRLRAHWDLMSRSIPDGASELESEVVGHLLSEGSLRPGDEVLDIGCGPGTHALHMAPVAHEVTCLDFSSGMLRRLERECGRAGLSNVRPLLSGWEDFVPTQAYDLVFSSYCPAVLDPGSVLRMEALSDRDCCLVSHLGGRRDPFVEMLSQLSGRDLSVAALDILFPMAMLRQMGRRPRLKVLEYELEAEGSTADEDCLLGYLSAFRELRGVSRGQLKECLAACAPCERVLRTGVLTWRRP